MKKILCQKNIYLCCNIIGLLLVLKDYLGNSAIVNKQVIFHKKKGKLAAKKIRYFRGGLEIRNHF